MFVSGTTQRGRGVFFKIRRSPQFTLEGEHTVVIRLAVSSDWRVGQLVARCRADGQEQWLWFDRDREWGRAEGVVRLYAAGDPNARLLAKHPRHATPGGRSYRQIRLKPGRSNPAADEDFRRVPATVNPAAD